MLRQRNDTRAGHASGHKAVVSRHLSQRQKLRHKRSIPGGFTQEEWERPLILACAQPFELGRERLSQFRISEARRHACGRQERSAILSLVVLQEADEMTRATRITERMLVHPPVKASASANRRGAAAMVKKRRPRPSPQRTGERLEPIAKNKDP